jgi:hypothetical protein
MKHKKSSKSVPQWRRSLIVTALIAGSALLLVQLALDVRLYRQSLEPKSEPIASMIIEAIQAVKESAVIEPTSKKVYLPDANLVLPPYPQNVSNIQYSYTPSFDGTDAEASVTLANAISVGISKIRNAEALGAQNHDSNALFDAVPEAQVCARGLHLVFGAKTHYKHLEFGTQLADGRTMKLYSEANSCSYDFDPLTAYLKQAQSY